MPKEELGTQMRFRFQLRQCRFGRKRFQKLKFEPAPLIPKQLQRFIGTSVKREFKAQPFPGSFKVVSEPEDSPVSGANTR